MATILSRSTAEILRLTRSQWVSGELTAFLVDTSAAGTPPTAASSVNTWLTYSLINYADFEFFDQPVKSFVSGDFSYDSTLNRAQTGEITFSFSAFIAANFSNFSSSTVTHVVFADLFNLATTIPPIAVVQESPARTLTSSSTLEYKIRVFGRSTTV